MLDDDQQTDDRDTDILPAKVGYCSPPTNTRFKPGRSGNPSGRPKGSKNIRTLFQSILKEEVSLREGAHVRKVSKGEAILRGLVVSALKGDPRSIATLFRLAEQAGEFEGRVPAVQKLVVQWKTNDG